MTGIYRITAPDGNVYIGQSRNIQKRIYDYSRMETSPKQSQKRLSDSFKKFGFDVHEIDVVCELPKDVSQLIINEYECLYIQLFVDAGYNLLNQRGGGYNNPYLNEEAKRDIIERKKQTVSKNQEIKKRLFKVELDKKKHDWHLNRLPKNYDEEYFIEWFNWHIDAANSKKYIDRQELLNYAGEHFKFIRVCLNIC